MRDELARLDLNLLVALHVLLEERSVTRAADRLCITQPAMSKTLQRLRDAFSDPLMVRFGRSLVLTPHAEALSERLTRILGEIGDLVLTNDFRPEAASGDLSIISSDTLALSLVPKLFLRVRASAPGIRLISDSFSELHLDLLAAGKRDFSIYVNFEYGPDFETFPLFQPQQVCWLRKDHPLALQAQVEVADIRRYGVISLTLPDGGRSPQEILAAGLVNVVKRYGLADSVVMHVTSVMTALRIVAESDLVILGIPLFNGPGPFEDDLTYRPLNHGTRLSDLVLIQHRRTMDSPLHRWFREQVLEVGRRTPASKRRLRVA